MNTIIKYGLLHKKSGKIIGFETLSNSDGAYCVGVKYELDHYVNNQWLVDKPEHAEYVRNHSTEWYNAGYDTPNHSYKNSELEVIKIIQTINVESVKIPTYKEYIELKRKKISEKDYEFYKHQYQKNSKVIYYLSDLLDILDEDMT